LEAKLTVIQSYKAMIIFLEGYYNRTGKPESLGILLGGFQFIKGEETVDPAVMNDWNIAVNKVLNNNHN
jgi:hypothetical protein